MPSVEEAEVVEYVDDLLAHLELKERILVRCLIALLEVQPLIFNGLAPKLFSQASLQEQTKNLRGWETSKVFQRRVVFMAIRTLLLWAYVDSHEAEQGMGLLPGTRALRRRNQALRDKSAPDPALTESLEPVSLGDLPLREVAPHASGSENHP
jgi:hypothetical protein